MNELPAYMFIKLKKVSTKRVMVSCCFFSLSQMWRMFFFSIVGCCFNENKYERKFKEYEICWLLSHHYICLCHAYAIECIGSMFVESTTHSELFFIFLFVWTIWGRIQVSNIQNYAAHLLMSSKKITRLLVSLLLYHVNFTCWNERTVLRCPFLIAHTYRWSSVQSVSIHWPNHLLNLLYSRKSDRLQKTSATVLFYQFIQIIDRKKGFHIIHVGQLYGDWISSKKSSLWRAYAYFVILILELFQVASCLVRVLRSI